MGTSIDHGVSIVFALSSGHNAALLYIIILGGIKVTYVLI